MKTYSTNEIYSDLYEQLINAVIPAGSKIKPVELQSKYGALRIQFVTLCCGYQKSAW